MERTNHAPSVLLLVATVLASCGGSASSDASAGHDGGTAGAGAAGAGAAGIGTGSGGTAGSASIDAGGGDADALTLVKLTFALPKKTYTLDSATFAIPAGNSVAVPCGGASLVQDCCNPPASASSVCSAQHSVKCDSSVCTVHQAVAVVQRMDFKLEVAALAGVGDQHLTDVSLSALDYAVDSNTLNVMVPTLEVYLAPTGVTTLSDPAAIKLGTVPSIPAGPAGQTSTGPVVRQPDADATLASFASPLGRSFNILVATTIVVPSGSPTPAGHLSLSVTGSVAATLAP